VPEQLPYPGYATAKDIGKLAIPLAKYTYFRPQVMSQCTVMGRGNRKPLDPSKLQRLRENIRSVFPMMDDDEQFGISARSLLLELASHYELIPDTCELEGHHIPPWTLVLYICEFECHHVPPLTLISVCSWHLWLMYFMLFEHDELDESTLSSVVGLHVCCYACCSVVLHRHWNVVYIACPCLWFVKACQYL